MGSAGSTRRRRQTSILLVVIAAAVHGFTGNNDRKSTKSGDGVKDADALDSGDSR